MKKRTMTNIDLMCIVKKLDLPHMAGEFTRATKYGKVYVHPTKVLKGLEVEQFEPLRDAFVNASNILTPLFESGDAVTLMKHSSFMLDVVLVASNYRKESKWKYKISDADLKDAGLRDKPIVKKKYEGMAALNRALSGKALKNRITREEYIKLSKVAHPDAGGDAEAFAILTNLYDKDFEVEKKSKEDVTLWQEERRDLDDTLRKTKQKKHSKRIKKQLKKIANYKLKGAK